MTAITLIKTDTDYYKIKGINEILYQNYNRNEIFEYDPKILLAENQAYTISNFDEQEFCPNFLKTELNSIDYDEALINIENNIYYFQRITLSSIQPKKFLKFFSDGTSYEKTDQQTTMITIFEQPDAIYNKNEKNYIF